jgi:hypothetical protein
MNNDNTNHSKRRSSLKPRAKSFREKTSSHHHKHDSVSINKEFIDSKDINFEIRSTTSSKKKHHRHNNNNYKKKGTFKSTFNNQKLKKVSFKENFTEVVQIENWKRYNTDLNEGDSDNEHDAKDKTKCTCVIQ